VFGRFSAIAFAVLFVLPGVLTFDALLRPAEAFVRIGRSKWRWTVVFVAAPAVSFALRSFVPALVVVPFTAYYLARVRSLLDVSTGLALEERGRPVLSPQRQEALAPLLMAPPLLVFLGIVLWTGDTRGRIVASVMVLSGLAVVAVVVVRNLRRL
jgi:hypothetical protein